MKTEAQKRAKKNYLKKGKRIVLDIYPSEQDLIDHLETQKAKQTYIKDLIRKDMNESKG